MTADVINLADVKAEREPHMTGTAQCFNCGHKHLVRVAVGTVEGIDCPECGLPKGVLVGLCEPADGVLRWACACGCQVFYNLENHMQCLYCGHAREYPE